MIQPFERGNDALAAFEEAADLGGVDGVEAIGVRYKRHSTYGRSSRGQNVPECIGMLWISLHGDHLRIPHQSTNVGRGPLHTVHEYLRGPWISG